MRAETLPLHELAEQAVLPGLDLSGVERRRQPHRPAGPTSCPTRNDLSNPPFEPACGLLPKLVGYGWRG